MKNKTHYTKGFTLIEVLVVVLIIGILASIALPQYRKAVEKAKWAEAETVLRHLKTVQDVCFLETGKTGTWDDDCKKENLFDLADMPNLQKVSAYGASFYCDNKNFCYVSEPGAFSARRVIPPSTTTIYAVYISSQPKSPYMRCYQQSSNDMTRHCKTIGFTNKSGSYYYRP